MYICSFVSTYYYVCGTIYHQDDKELEKALNFLVECGYLIETEDKLFTTGSEEHNDSIRVNTEAMTITILPDFFRNLGFYLAPGGDILGDNSRHCIRVCCDDCCSEIFEYKNGKQTVDCEELKEIAKFFNVEYDDDRAYEEDDYREAMFKKLDILSGDWCAAALDNNPRASG